MESKNSVEDKYKRVTKVTSALWRFWWFSIYLLVIPGLITLVSFPVISFFADIIEIFGGPDIWITSGLAVIIFLFSALFFYRFFDRYKNKPMFYNQENNLTSRIHILFLISFVSFMVTPVFVFITPPEYQFELLPLVSFCVLYNIVYFYYSLKPIDYFDSAERAFKKALSSSLSMKQPYNFIIFINYVIQIIYLSFIFTTGLSWVLGLIFNLLFYLITLSSTRKLRNKITTAIKGDNFFMVELSQFRQKFSISILTLDFILLLQIPFIGMLSNIITNSALSYTVMDFLNALMYSVLIFLIYLKIRVYFSINYQKFLMRVA